MPKPKHERLVDAPPQVDYFKPRGIPLVELEQVTLGVDEYEAIRLCDLELLSHEAAAERMEISRPTFTRILEAAHRIIADAIVHGKAIAIEGGSFRFARNRSSCRACRFVWENKTDNNAKIRCPKCGSTEVDDLARRCGKGRGACRGGHGRRHGRHGNPDNEQH